MTSNNRSFARVIGPLALAWLLTTPSTASASLLSPEAEDKMAGFLAVFILFFVPVAFIVLFWLVHILPEKIAHQRHHPQFEAIRTLCLLSLVFGGLLWPLAWLWAYTKPIGYKLAYGTDKVDHDALEHDAGGHGPSEQSDAAELKAVRAELAALQARVRNGEAV